MVRVDSQKHIDFALSSPFGGGRPGRVKRAKQCASAPPCMHLLIMLMARSGVSCLAGKDRGSVAVHC